MEEAMGENVSYDLFFDDDPLGQSENLDTWGTKWMYQDPWKKEGKKKVSTVM
jgi:hypothetical protein